MVVDFPDSSTSHFKTFDLGTRVLCMTRDRQGDHHLHALDFSLRGCGALDRLGGGLKKKRRVLSSPERIWSPRKPNNEVAGMRVLGDSLATCSVGDW